MLESTRLYNIELLSKYGCSLNILSVEALFSRYRQLGFLYPGKLKRLLPFMGEIRRNWEKGLSSKNSILDVIFFESDHFDLVYSRFLFEYLPNKKKALDEIIRVCKSGGKIILQDLDGQLLWHEPVDVDLQNDVEKILSHLKKTGFDPFVGRKLFSLAKSSGLTDIQVKIEPYHLFVGEISSYDYELWDLKLDIAIPIITEAMGGMDNALTFKKRYLEYLRREDTMTFSLVFTVVGTVA